MYEVNMMNMKFVFSSHWKVSNLILELWRQQIIHPIECIESLLKLLFYATNSVWHSLLFSKTPVSQKLCKMYSLQYIAFITRCQHRQILAKLVSRQKLKLWDFDQTLLLPLIYVCQHLHKCDDDVLCLYNTIIETLNNISNVH